MSMGIVRMAVVLGAAALVGGCEAKMGNGATDSASNGSASAEGKAEEGKIAFSAPGFDLKIQVPLDRAEADGDNHILYPGSKLTGMYIDAHPNAKAGSDGEVELRFGTPDAPEKVAAWYRDPGRAGDFALTSTAREGPAFVLAGTEKGDGNGFRLRLEPKGTGTDGRLTLRDKD
jgi:hypothetical protein